MDYQRAHDDLITLGGVSIKLASVTRVMLYGEDKFENDAEHSFHLGLSAVELAGSYYPNLDTGLVAQFSLVHDLTEAYVGDIPSFKIQEDEKRAKEEAEAIALEKLLNELPAHTATLLKRYEQQSEQEARFVRLIDKLIPAVVHIVEPDSNKKYFLKRFDVEDIRKFDEGMEKRAKELADSFPEFDTLMVLQGMLTHTSRTKLFDRS